MKSIANQYKDLKEGRMSQANFMRNLRMSMPQYITNTTSFNDAIRILKNKAILTETYDGGPEDLAKMAQSSSELRSKPITKAIAQKAAENANSKEEAAALAVKLAKAKGITDSEHITQIVDLAASMVNEVYADEGEDEDEIDAIIKQMEQGEEEEKGLKSGYGIYDPLEEDEELNEYEHTYRKIGGVCYKIDDEGNKTRVADHYCRYSEELNEAKKKKEAKKELHPNQINPDELRMGMKVELEHTDDLDKAKKIALDHLAENPYYYTALKLAGIDSPSAPKVKAPVEKKAKKGKEAVELVDKANAMQKVKMPKIVKEARLNIDGEPNAVVKQAMGYVDGPNANPTLKALSNQIEFQQSMDPNEALLRYGYWEMLPDEAIKKLELQFNVEVDRDFDEDTGELSLYRLTPKNKLGGGLGSSLEQGASKASQMDTFKESLEALVREVLAETFDGRDNLDAENEY